jgi:hypothetical protein
MRPQRTSSRSKNRFIYYNFNSCLRRYFWAKGLKRVEIHLLPDDVFQKVGQAEEIEFKSMNERPDPGGALVRPKSKIPLKAAPSKAQTLGYAALIRPRKYYYFNSCLRPSLLG